MAEARLVAPAAHFRSHDGARLALYRADAAPVRPGAPAVLVTHAAGFAALAYRELARALSHDFSVWAMDLRGHGASDCGQGFDVGALKADFLAAGRFVRRAEKDRRLFLFAHSLSGAIALALDDAVPWDGLITFDAAVFPPPHHEERPGAEALLKRRLSGIARKRTHWPSTEAYREYLAARPPFRDWPCSAVSGFAEATAKPSGTGGLSLACSAGTEAAAFAMLPGLSASLDLTRLRTPLVALAADGVDPSATWASRVQPWVVSQVPISELVVVRGQGHLAPISAPELIASETVKAVDSNRSAFHALAQTGHEADPRRSQDNKKRTTHVPSEQ